MYMDTNKMLLVITFGALALLLVCWLANLVRVMSKKEPLVWSTEECIFSA